ncbi:MAG: N-acetylglucosamine-6-phosphate deacetylase [Mangrovibacterium sp.]
MEGYKILNRLRDLLAAFLLFNGNLLNAQERIEGLFYHDLRPVSIEIAEGKIVRISRLKELSEPGDKVYIAPGLIDNQVNGFADITFSLGSGGLTLEGVKKATKALWQVGVTTYMPTLTTNSRELLLKNLSVLVKAKEEADLYGSIAGFHFEGPYISPEDGYRGAHPLKYVRKPDWKEFMDFYKVSGANIMQVTLAPEIEGAMDFIRKCTALGITVAIGHHHASAELIDKAVLNGVKICTHLGNGCANMINRHLNPLWPQLSADRLLVSIIGDGFHLLPEEIRVFYKVKGVEKIILTSDATQYSGLPPGKYETEEGDPIEITWEGKLWNIAQNGLYGSASSLARGVVHVMQVTGCALGDAIQMASTNPAKLYGLKDRGTIEPGKRADLILFTIGERELNIRKTYVAGKLVYDASNQ